MDYLIIKKLMAELNKVKHFQHPSQDNKQSKIVIIENTSLFTKLLVQETPKGLFDFRVKLPRLAHLSAIHL